MKKRVGIIGGGASGLVAAIGAARNGAEVTVIEHMDRVGKKILSTGNGRCNLTNYKMEEDCYRCGRKDFPMQVIRGFDVKETLDLFMGLGIVPKDRNGYVYPNSDQAASVLDVLRTELSPYPPFLSDRKDRKKEKRWLSCTYRSGKGRNRCPDPCGWFQSSAFYRFRWQWLRICQTVRTFCDQATSGSGPASLSGKFIQTDGRDPHGSRSEIAGRRYYPGK